MDSGLEVAIAYFNDTGDDTPINETVDALLAAEYTRGAREELEKLLTVNYGPDLYNSVRDRLQQLTKEK